MLLIALNAFSHGWDPKRQGKKFYHIYYQNHEELLER